MNRLAPADVQVLGACLGELYAAASGAGDYAEQATRTLVRAVPADSGSYNEIDARGVVRLVVVPAPRRPDLQAVLSRHAHEHPTVRHYRMTGQVGAFRFSDLVTRRQLHRLPLYNEYYRHLDIEHQVTLRLPTPPRVVAGFALSRRRGRDFSTRDRLFLDLLAPHLVQAQATAQATTGLRARLVELEGTLESVEGLVLLGPGTTVAFASARTRETLKAWFPDVSGPSRLPGALADWLRCSGTTGRRGTGTAGRAPLILTRGDRWLRVRMVDANGRRSLVVEEGGAGPDPLALQGRGLTPREAEVLVWVARGKTNEETGSILGTRTATVAKHLERIYEKLGVETRTAAAIEALALGSPARR
jgi:DNA-binding CsgD family transcriptional regulator